MTDSKHNYPKSYDTQEDEVIPGLPCFVDTSSMPWVKTVEDNCHIIQKELNEFLENVKVEDYFLERYPSFATGYCGRLDLKFFNMPHPNSQYFKQTLAIMDGVNNCIRMTINLLKGHSGTKPHNAENDAYYRGHLALKIPGTLPTVGFKVGNETKSWEEGKVNLFIDAQNHKAFNDSDDYNYVLVFDVWRDEYQSVLHDTIIHTLSLYTVALMNMVITSEVPTIESGKHFLLIEFYEVEKACPPNLLQLYKIMKQFYEASYHNNKFSDAAMKFFWDLWDQAGGF